VSSAPRCGYESGPNKLNSSVFIVVCHLITWTPAENNRQLLRVFIQRAQIIRYRPIGVCVLYQQVGLVRTGCVGADIGANRSDLVIFVPCSHRSIFRWQPSKVCWLAFQTSCSRGASKTTFKSWSWTRFWKRLV